MEFLGEVRITNMHKFTNDQIQILGKVIHGNGFGKVLGCPTANIDRRDYSRQKLNLKIGIWSGEVVFSLKSIDSRLKTYKAAIVIEPKDSKGLPKIEAHLINFKGNLYGKKVKLTLYKFIRPFKKFKNIEDLKYQIGKDVDKIKKL